MRWWSIALVAFAGLAGCDKLFDVDHVGAPADDAMADAETFFDAPEQCPGVYKEIPGTPDTSRYLWVGMNIEWAAAEADCEGHTRTKVTHLVVFEEIGEMLAVRAQLDMMFGQFASHAGYARNVQDDPFQFFSVTGDALPTSGPPWNPNEPTGLVGVGEETTVRFESLRDLTDQPYAHPVSYLCECDHRPVTKTFTLNED
jgi:hypothetical protein